MSLPERLGRLRRVERLGEGGFATVWRYRDAELRSDVAVKALAENWAQRFDVRERFLEEARILRQADSDHVVRVYDIGEADGTPYFVMSYADLGSLATLLEPGTPLPPQRVRELVEQAAAGLAVLHDHGIIHRDVKPQNLLRRSSGSAGERLLVADLGVAKAALHASGITQVVGTPAYMAPEQASGLGVDIRADIHALGAVAYHLLTGRQVRTGGLSELVDASLPPPPSSLVQVNHAVDEVLMTALRPLPEDRFDTVQAFAAALRAAIPPTSGDTVGTTPARPDPTSADDAPTSLAASTADQTAPQHPSGLGTAVLVLLVFVATFAVAYGATWLLDR